MIKFLLIFVSIFALTSCSQVSKIIGPGNEKVLEDVIEDEIQEEREAKKKYPFQEFPENESWNHFPPLSAT